MASWDEIKAVAERDGYDLTTAAGRARAERVAQGLPPTITDKVVLAQIEQVSRPRPAVAS